MFDGRLGDYVLTRCDETVTFCGWFCIFRKNYWIWRNKFKSLITMESENMLYVARKMISNSFIVFRVTFFHSPLTYIIPPLSVQKLYHLNWILFWAKRLTKKNRMTRHIRWDLLSECDEVCPAHMESSPRAPSEHSPIKRNQYVHTLDIIVPVKSNPIRFFFLSWTVHMERHTHISEAYKKGRLRCVKWTIVNQQGKKLTSEWSSKDHLPTDWYFLSANQSDRYGVWGWSE